jgi:uncharacterized membrane protein YfcA
MEIAGYFLALLIGLSLGMIGSGGTILSLPIIVYFFHISPIEATHYSLFIVAITAATGTIRNFREKFVDVPTAVFFLVPSLIAVIITRHYILPNLPAQILGISNQKFLLILFAVVMLAASISMIRSSRDPEIDCFEKIPQPNAHHFQTSIAALIVGILTGLLGAGGGFLIVPVLILLKKHCMRRATGTSLLIITLNSATGFVSNIHAPMNWPVVLGFTVIACIGMLMGVKWSDKIRESNLKRIFGLFVLVVGIFMIVKELFIR